jgi:hypothetical protein
MHALVQSALAADPAVRRRGEEGLRASEKSAGHLLRLMECLAAELSAPGYPSAAALLCAQAMQKALRRAPPAELESCGLGLVDALRAAAERRWTAGLTQLALAASVAMIRSTDLSLLASFDGERSESNRAIALRLLTLLAEELHSPASRISAPPGRLEDVRQALRRSGPHTLSLLHSWFDQAASAAGGDVHPHLAAAAAESAAAVLRAAGAWCTCGLLAPAEVAACPLFTRSAAAALQHPVTAPDAADALCAAMDVLTEQAPVAQAAGGVRRGGRGKGEGGRSGRSKGEGGSGGDQKREQVSRE